MRSPTRPAADEIGMRCKPLFYFSRGSLAFGRWQCHTLSSRAKNHGSLAMLIQSSVVGLWQYPDPVIPSKESSFACERRFGVEGPCVSAWDDGLLDVNQRPTTDSDPYPGLSRCTTFTRYPAVRKRFETSSAIMTDRCCPPVQPKEIVR